MFYLCKTVIDSDFYTKILINSSKVYLVRSASIAAYNVEGGKLKHVKTMRFFDVVKSADIVGDKILMVFNGYLTVLDEFLCGEHDLPSIKGENNKAQPFASSQSKLRDGAKSFLPVIDRYRFGRSSVDYRNVGSYVAHTGQTICLVSFFGQMLFYTINMGFSDPIEYSTSGVILDFKAVKGTRLYLSLEKNNEKVVLRIYEHTPGVIVAKNEISVPGGYSIMTLEDGACAIFATDKVFLVKSFRSIETYKILKADPRRLERVEESVEEEADLVDAQLFTSFSSHTTPRYSLTLILNEIGEVFRVEAGAELKLTYVTKINPAKDIAIHPEGFLISIGHDSDNCVYYLKEAEDGEVNLELTDVLKVFGISRTSALVYDGMYHVYLSNSNYLKEIVKRKPLAFLSKLELPREDEKNVGEVFASQGTVCAAYERVVYNLAIDGNEFRFLYKLKFEDEVIGYIKLRDTHFYLMNNSVGAVETHSKTKEDPKDGSSHEGWSQATMVDLPDSSFLVMRQRQIHYDLYSASESSLFLAYENKITRITPKSTDIIELDFIVKGLASNDQYLFVLTGRRVLRIYSLLGRRYVFIQSFQTDVMFLTLFSGHLYTIGEKIYRFKISDGSLSLPKQLKCNDIPIGVKDGLILFKSKVVDLKSEETMEIDGYTSVLVGGKVVAIDGFELSMYKYEYGTKFSFDILADEGEYKIICREAAYIENIGDTFKIKKLTGSTIVEGTGKAIDFSSSEEHQVASICEGFKMNNEEIRHDDGSRSPSTLCSRKVDFSADHSESEYSLQVFMNNSLLYEYKITYKAEIVAINGKMIYCGSNTVLYGYEIGKKTLLKKLKVNLPSRITKVCLGDSMVFVGTEKDSVCVVKDDVLLCNEQVPRHITTLEKIDQKRLIAGDKSGSILAMEFSENSLCTKASLFINDMPIQIIPGDRVFAICLSGKVYEIVEIEDSLFEFFEKVEREVKDGLKKPFFEIFRRNGFVDAEYLKMFCSLGEKQIKEASGRINVDVEKIFDVISLL